MATISGMEAEGKESRVCMIECVCNNSVHNICVKSGAAVDLSGCTFGTQQ